MPTAPTATAPSIPTPATCQLLLLSHCKPPSCGITCNHTQGSKSRIPLVCSAALELVCPFLLNILLSFSFGSVEINMLLCVLCACLFLFVRVCVCVCVCVHLYTHIWINLTDGKATSPTNSSLANAKPPWCDEGRFVPRF